MKRIIMPFAILAVSVVLAVVLIRTPTVVEEASPETFPVTVRVTAAQLQSVQLHVESRGKVQAAKRANLAAAVAGAVEWISPTLEEGGYVEAGQVLLRLEASDYQTTLARSLASMQQAQAEADHSLREYNRINGLAEQKLVSDSQLQDSLRSSNVNKAKLADAQASFKQAELDLARVEIRSPFNAIVASKDVELGQYINKAQSFALLYAADVVEVRVPLAIKQLGYLDIPLAARGELPADIAPQVTLTGFYAGQQQQWMGTLVRTEATIDELSNSVQTIIRVTQPSTESVNSGQLPLPIGLFVQAKIAGKYIDEIIALPRKVIRNGNQVLVVDAENKMYYRTVEILRLEEDRVLISGGISPGERICISPIQAVVDGMSVQPIIETI
ncbi:MAG: hypothetical protein COC19_04115 [SAR86 cluster bacterium]|uniref:Efflux transporter periplasmic adaptor subunit n=1 Tax=SAR86 cluster bacterium TaxID=2030880 RepID=A0A2A4MP45_9GAMM|nr:MAG: hypothetical protein COC19_04115 [SAR86 cluster bacterium]